MGWNKSMILKDYKKNLEDELCKDLSEKMDVCSKNYRYHMAAASMIATIKNIDDILEHQDDMYEAEYAMEGHEKHELTPEQIHTWVDHMENVDGTTGAHWTMDQTTTVANQYGVAFDHIRECDWYAALNSRYSDNYKTLNDAGITDIGVYVGLAKDFLFDKDAVPPKEKLYYYYKYIVRK